MSMVKFNKLQELAKSEWGRMTSHEILARMEEIKRERGGTGVKNDKGEIKKCRA